MNGGLPERYTVRAGTLDDAQAVTDLMNACAVADMGHPDTDVSEILGDWRTPFGDPQTNVRLVLDDDRLVGGAGFWAEPPCAYVWAWCRVHPEHKERGIGTYLARWLVVAVREVALPRAPAGIRVSLRQMKPDTDADSHAFLLAQGYKPVRHFLRMGIDLSCTVPLPRFPEGVKVRHFDRATDLPGLVRVEQDIFRDHWGYVPLDFDQDLSMWAHWIDNDPLFDPTLWFLVMDGDDIAAVCLCQAEVPGEPDVGYVRSLGVQRKWRRHGLGLAMLQLAFGEFHRRGKARVTLDVDAESLTGATRLYEKAGMRILWQKTAFELALREGVDLSTQTLSV